MSGTYVHGENERLQDQAGTLVDLLHAMCYTFFKGVGEKSRPDRHAER